MIDPTAVERAVPAVVIPADGSADLPLARSEGATSRPSYTQSRKFLPVGGTGLQSRVHVESEVIPLTEIVPRARAGAEISWNAY